MNHTRIKKIAIFAVLVGLMAVTRSHHFDSMSHLPDASLAVFMLAGFFLPMAAFPALLAVAGFADYFAFNYAGISDWCFSPAYWFLIPTYAVLFYAGRFYATRHAHAFRSLGLFAAVVLVSMTAAFVISNASFYLFSGRFSDMSVMQYANSVAQYFLPYQLSSIIYLIPAVLSYAVWSGRTSAVQHAG